MSTDLKGELASLKIDRTRKAASPWRWPLLLFVPVILVLGVLYALRVRQALSAPEVETATVLVSRDAEPSAGTPILTASGYVVARRKAVVSAKIQGRLSWLGVEEGSEVREGQVIARLESIDYEASVERAKAAVLRAEADLAESERQLRLAEKLTRGEASSRSTSVTPAPPASRSPLPSSRRPRPTSPSPRPSSRTPRSGPPSRGWW